MSDALPLPPRPKALNPRRALQAPFCGHEGTSPPECFGCGEPEVILVLVTELDPATDFPSGNVRSEFFFLRPDKINAAAWEKTLYPGWLRDTVSAPPFYCSCGSASQMLAAISVIAK